MVALYLSLLSLSLAAGQVTQLRSLEAVQRAAGRTHVSSLAEGPTPLPLYERLKAQHRVHPRLHPQRYPDETDTRRRRAQGSGEALTVENTEQLTIFADYSSFYEQGEEVRGHTSLRPCRAYTHSYGPQTSDAGTGACVSRLLLL